MDKIASFTVNHLALEPVVYVSRVDHDPASGASRHVRLPDGLGGESVRKGHH